jgi:acyl dehydratase
METVGLGLYYEDLTLGRKFKTVGRTVTDADITLFVGVTGMTEVLFTDAEFLKSTSLFAGRPAPGALIYSLAEGLLVQSTMQHTGLAFLHMELEMKGPVLAGETIHVECEVIEARLSNSKPGRGLVRTRNNVVKHNGDIALVYTPLRMIKRRPPAPH